MAENPASQPGNPEVKSLFFQGKGVQLPLACAENRCDYLSESAIKKSLGLDFGPQQTLESDASQEEPVRLLDSRSVKEKVLAEHKRRLERVSTFCSSTQCFGEMIQAASEATGQQRSDIV